MISSGHLIGFTLASLVIIVIPGPGVLFVVGRALSHGWRTAVATAAGHAAGNYLVAACVAVGLGALLRCRPTVRWAQERRVSSGASLAAAPRTSGRVAVP
jgi:threonine/homoserine/homoserine lactone efflux protein